MFRASGTLEAQMGMTEEDGLADIEQWFASRRYGVVYIKGALGGACNSRLQRQLRNRFSSPS